MTTFAPEYLGSPEKYVLLSDGAFDQARAEGVADVSLDLAVLKDATDRLNVRPSHVPMLLVVELETDGRCKTEKYRPKYKEVDPPTFISGASVWEDAPPTISRLGEHARRLECQTLAFVTISSLLDPIDHYTGLLRGIAAMRHTATLHQREELACGGLGMLPERVDAESIYKPRGAFRRHADEVIEACDETAEDNPWPFTVTYR